VGRVEASEHLEDPLTEQLTRLTVDLLRDDVENLEVISNGLAMSRTEVIQQSLATQRALLDRAAPGETVVVQRRDGKERIRLPMIKAQDSRS